jgi:hypothetical protein
MCPEGPVLRRPLAASAGDPAARATDGPRPAPRSGSGPLQSDGYGNRETWRRILAAHVQPLPGAAD